MLIVDAGGGTIDITTYGHDSKAAGFSFQEIATPQCQLLILCKNNWSLVRKLNFVVESTLGFFQGSVFVTNRAHAFLDGIARLIYIFES